VKSKKGYWIGGGLIVLGGVLAALWFVISFVRLDDQIDGFARVPVPGEQTVRLEARKYIVYYEGFAALEIIPTPDELTIADAESGDDLEIEPYAGSLTYSFGERDGSAQGTVTPPRAGDYVVTTNSEDAGSNAAVALGDSIATPLLRTIVGTIVIGALLVLAGVIMLVVTAIRRNRNAPAPPS
jgi:hypothetical protein